MPPYVSLRCGSLQVENPFLDLVFQPPTVERFALRKSFKGHLNSVSAVAFHPRKVGTAFRVSVPFRWGIGTLPFTACMRFYRKTQYFD